MFHSLDVEVLRVSRFTLVYSIVDIPQVTEYLVPMPKPRGHKMNRPS